MAFSAERDQIFFQIVAQMASEFLVVNLQIRHRAARLASPSIAMQHLLPKTLERNRI